jgi:CBS domain-containing protein
MTQQIVHLSGLLGSPLVDRSGERLGRVEDVIVRLDDEFPPVTGLRGRLGDRELFIPTDRIASLSSDSAQLSGELLDLRRFERRPGEVLLGEDVLGRKLIHVEAARLVTAHEIELACVDGWWRVVGINPSRRVRLRRLLRRGGTEHRAQEPLIEWTQLEPFVGHVPTSRLRIRHRKLAKLHPAQIADLVEAASHDEGEEIIQAVGQDRELEADVFEELDDEHQLEFIRERSDDEAAKLLARMAPDDAADLIAELDQERREPVLSLLPPKQQRRVRNLLGYNPSTAGGLMSPDYVALPETATVADALRRVRESDTPPEVTSTVFLTDGEGKVCGSVPVVELIRSSERTPLVELNRGEPPMVHPDADLPEVANLMTDFNLVALPVVDENDRMVGVITVDDVLELMLPTGWRWRHRVAQGS